MTQTQAPLKTMMHVDIGSEELLEIYYKMLLSRTVDERLWQLHRQGKINFHVSAMGHEAAQAAIASNFIPGKDFAAGYYRDLTTALVFGLTARDVMLAAFAKAGDKFSGGRQMPSHFSSRALHIVTVSSPVATQLPHAVGIALAAKLRGEDTVVYTACGEGSAQKGDFHEACNFAGVHKLPVVFVIQNNGYAISEPLSEEAAVPNLSIRAEGYGFPGVTVDGMDVFETYHAAQTAVARARRGEGPTLVEAKCYRLTPHSSDDDDRRYRSREEVDSWKTRDPLPRFQRQLLELGVLEEALDRQVRARVTSEVDEATEFAEQAPWPRGEEAMEHVYAKARA
jgi:2-oxoisovalerate dehydrogenase E1 component alpha subunit